MLNLIDENICFDGKKLIFVPFFFVFPIFFKGFTEFPSLKLISYSLPLLPPVIFPVKESIIAPSVGGCTNANRPPGRPSTVALAPSHVGYIAKEESS